MWISLFLIPWVFILLCSSYPQLNEYFLIQMCDETPVNCVVFTAWMRRVTKQEWRELCRPSSGVWLRKLYGYSTLFILQNVVTVMYLWVCNFWCAQRNWFFLFLFFQVPGTFLLFLWVKTRETNFLGIAEGGMSKAQDGNMGDGWTISCWAPKQWYRPSCFQKCAYSSGVCHTTIGTQLKHFSDWLDLRCERILK